MPSTSDTDPCADTDADSRIYDTYYAALQHDSADVPSNAWLVGVVNYQMYGFSSVVEENFSALAPPEDLFDEFRARRESLVDAGYEKADAHNTAWAETNFADRYESYLVRGWETNTAVREQCDAILSTAETRPVAVVCYEAANKKCHRSVLTEFLTEKETES